MEGRTAANREGMGLIDALLPYMEKGLNKIIDARLLQERFFFLKLTVVGNFNSTNKTEMYMARTLSQAQLCTEADWLWASFCVRVTANGVIHCKKKQAVGENGKQNHNAYL